MQDSREQAGLGLGEVNTSLWDLMYVAWDGRININIKED